MQNVFRTILRSAAIACILMLAAATVVGAAADCCEDDCSGDDRGCVTECGSCGIAVVMSAADSALTLSRHVAPLYLHSPPAHDLVIRDILHVPRQLL